MNQKTKKYIYFTATGLLSALMLFSAGMEVFNYEEMASEFNKLGYPTYIIYPLALTKILGLIAIWTKKSNVLKEWAYSGFFFNFILAFSAHIKIADGKSAPALVALILLLLSYIFEKKVNAS
ncbi:MAG: DoxX family protein [Saprospiraceae bacterium]|nr:DoxX family protein [Saprospiraceae bacterium]